MTFSPIEVAITAALLNFAGMWAIAYINILNNRRNNGRKSIEEALRSKVNKTECEPAMKRIGREVDRLEKCNDTQNSTIHSLESGISYLVGKSGGDYRQIKDTGINLR